ncbi:MAG: aldo/keto reductase [Oscillospiraceae bacterium]|nr:aldo/keto reductase [Oscillospiraceae bacterium]
MKQTTLGRTGIVTTATGLGCGGFSRLGLEKFGQAHAAGIVRAAYDLGIRFFDTATVYGTEPAVGEGLEGIPRDSYTVSTKFPLWDKAWRDGYQKRFEETLETSLRNLKTDYIDVYNIHGVPLEDYADVKELLVPLMIKAQAAGKIRFLGITERFAGDTAHEMLNVCLDDNIFDVAMVGYNLMNPSAVKTVFPRTIKNNVGVQCMFAVRHALHDPVQMKAEIQKILDHGQGGEGLEATENALDFLKEPGVASSIMDAAYRYCAHTGGVNIVLTGTSNENHLRDNLKSLESKALPKAILEKLNQLFGDVDCVCAQDF